MHDYIQERCLAIAVYMLENQATVRQAAAKFGVSKSTVHTDITVRLRRIDPSLYAEVRKVLDINKEERHIRGGIATREKYKRETECMRV